MSELETITTLPKLPPRPADGHKGLFGRVLVVGGNEGMIGAPVLAATAALRCGSGLVQIAAPRTILSAALSITPELIGLGLGKAGGKDGLLAAGEKADAIVIGPGMGSTSEGFARLRRLMRLEKPAVVDADGLNLLAAEKRWPKWFRARAVLTPHPGEMNRLGKLFGMTQTPADDEGRMRVAAEAARAFGQVVVLKGHRSVITDGSRVYVNTTGDSTLSKAGSGDVLSGVIGCLLGQGVDPFEAACLGAHVHGLAGEAAGKRLGRRSALARDVLDELGGVLSRMESPS